MKLRTIQTEVLRETLPRGDEGWLSEETTDSEERIGAHRVWVVDANLPAATLGALVAARGAGITLLADPVSVAKAPRLQPVLQHIDVFFPNVAEAAALANGAWREPSELADDLRRQGVGTVVLSLGAEGVLCVDRSGLRRESATAGRVVDVTGAGDAFLTGYVFALVSGKRQYAIAYGLAAAGLTVESAASVPPDLSAGRLLARLEGRI